MTGFFKNLFEKPRPVPDPVSRDGTGRDTGSFHHWLTHSDYNSNWMAVVVVVVSCQIGIQLWRMLPSDMIYFNVHCARAPFHNFIWVFQLESWSISCRSRRVVRSFLLFRCLHKLFLDRFEVCFDLKGEVQRLFYRVWDTRRCMVCVSY